MSETATVDRTDLDQVSELQPNRRTRKATDSRPKRQPPYAVILHNDDYNGMDYVVRVLRKVFGYTRTKAVWLMMKAHLRGAAQVWSGSLEVAELKADQLRGCGPDPNMANRGAGKIRASIEPLQ